MVERRVPDPQPIVDIQLVVAAREGSRNAFDVLVDRYYAPINAYLFRLVGDREVAADLTQETFFTAQTRLHRVDANRSFAAWLYRVAHYTARPYLRRQRLRKFVSFDQLTGWVDTRVGGPSAAAISDATERELIQQVLDALPDNQRVAVLLHSLAGFTIEEVASILGIKVDAATKRVARGRQQFRELYREMSVIDDRDQNLGASR